MVGESGGPSPCLTLHSGVKRIFPRKGSFWFSEPVLAYMIWGTEDQVTRKVVRWSILSREVSPTLADGY